MKNLEQLIQEGKEMTKEERNQLLYVACLGNNLFMAKVAVAYGADVNFNDTEALIAAVKNGHKEMVDYLLKEGANPNAQESYALFLASRENHFEILEMLLNAGSDITSESAEQSLITACEKKHKKIVELLLKAGVKATVLDNEAIIRAVKVYHQNVVIIESGVKEPFKDTLQERKEIAEMLLKRHANPNAKDAEALIIAVEQRDRELVEMLVEHGADINARNSEALIISLTKGDIVMQKLLIDLGINVNARAKEALSIVMLDYYSYTIMGNEKMQRLQMLIDAGLDVTIDSNSLLLSAVYRYDVKTIRMIINAGADVNAQDGEALKVAVDMMNYEKVQTLLDAEADPSVISKRVMFSLLKDGQIKIFRALKEAKKR